MKNVIDIPMRPVRTFLPENFIVTTWEELKPYLDKLVQQKIDGAADLKNWLHNRSELESVLSEDMGWRYIRMTSFTDNEEYSKSYHDFVQNIQPQAAPYTDLLNKKALESPFLKELEHVAGYDMMIRSPNKTEPL